MTSEIPEDMMGEDMPKVEGTDIVERADKLGACRHTASPQPTSCTCGYKACCGTDFNEHVLASMHDNDHHFEARG